MEDKDPIPRDQLLRGYCGSAFNHLGHTVIKKKEVGRIEYRCVGRIDGINYGV